MDHELVDRRDDLGSRYCLLAPAKPHELAAKQSLSLRPLFPLIQCLNLVRVKIMVWLVASHHRLDCRAEREEIE